MTEEAFTPGPLRAVGIGVFAGRWRIAHCDMQAESAPDEEKTANAKLFAASPSLYDACGRALIWLETVEGSEAIRSVLFNVMKQARGK